MFGTNLLAAAPAGGGMVQMLMMIVPMFLIFYFLLIRPQQKQQKAFREMISNVGRGDEIITSGGIKGKVTRAIDDNEVELEIAPDIRVRLSRSGIAAVTNSKHAPAAKENPKGKKATKKDDKKVEVKEEKKEETLSS